LFVKDEKKYTPIPILVALTKM